MNVKHLLRILFFMVLIALVLAKGHKDHSKHSNKKDIKKQSDISDDEKEVKHGHHHYKSSDEDSGSDNSSGDDDDDDDDDNDDDTEEEIKGDKPLKYKDNNEDEEDDNEDSDQDDNNDNGEAEAETDNDDNDVEIETETDNDDEQPTTTNNANQSETTTENAEPTETSVIGDITPIVNDCDAIKSFLGEKESNIKDCTFDDAGKITYLYFSDDKLTEEEIEKIYSYNSITNLHIYWKGNQYTIDKAVALINLTDLSIFTTKGGQLNLSAWDTFEKINTLIVAAPSSKSVHVKIGSFKGFKALRNLQLRQFHFSQVIIDEIGKLENLEEINCDSCGFSSGLNYESFKNLSNLRTIHFTSFNKYSSPIREIPIPFTEIKSLRTLIMTRQKISEIPEELANLTNLEVLNLNNNLLTKIPENLNKLENLKEAYFSGNLEGKILTNDSLIKCSYDNYEKICKTKEMDCLGEEKLLINFCS